ncbi:ABC transporter permease [Leucobacter coleopterorum]|uniref:ABC transporter permease n=1 Tax=Leucobacter coleopterorum TaxID=2714933 RepID=A0ABX6JZ03_9MICO|nr:ABC transporter permease [Leucobacter coleopterorum]QIM19551.1 ABC transporter permease [Leucobacter coleopterorum]
MKTLDLIGTAISNTFRSKTRTILTILAIFVGAFTLTLTSGLGTGINAYIDDTVSGVGSSNAMTVTGTAESTNPIDAGDSGPAEYNPDAIAAASAGPPGQTVIALTPADIDTISSTKGVEKVHATRSISPDYVQVDGGKQYVASVGSLVAGQTTLLAAGAEPSNTSESFEVAIPDSYVKSLGFKKADDAIGATLTIGITDAVRGKHTVEAKIVGVTEEALVSPLGPSILPNNTLTDRLFELQSTGIPADQADRYSSATVWFASDATDAQVSALKDRLAEEGFTGTTVADQLGTIKTVIDGIVLVLNAFAIIALLAASFGIVNTLYMSVQERTREIGLMKAMGMGSGRVFSLFSLEAAFLGFLGSAIGVVIAMGAGTALSSVLSTSLLADLNGLTLIAFDPGSIATIILVVMGIAFLAGTLPAARAAKADPVTSLRYE